MKLWLRIPLVLSMSALGAAGVAEVYLRTRLPLDAMLLERDDALLFRPTPGARRVDCEWGASDWYLTRLNSLGHRGPELGGKGDQPRVAFYGDERVQGSFVHEDEAMSARFEACLDGEVESANAGVGGYGPDQALLKFLEDYEALQPDVVVLVLSAIDDGGDLLHNQIVYVGEGGTTQIQQPQVSLAAAKDFRFRAGSRHPSQLRAWRERRTHGATSFPLIGNWLTCAKLDAEAYLAHAPIRDLLFDYLDEDLVAAPESESARLKRELYTVILEAWMAACDERGVQLLITIVPSWRYPELAAVVQETLPEGLASLDLVTRFEELGIRELSDGRLGYFATDLRLPAPAHELIGVAVAQELGRLGWLGES